METLGRLVDKLIVTKLKLAHLPELSKGARESRCAWLASQLGECLKDIHSVVTGAAHGAIPLTALRAPACKVYPGKDEPPPPEGSLAHLIDYLAEVNAALWGVQEDIARIREVPPAEKDDVVERCFDLNMERSRTIDAIDRAFVELLKESKSC